ncbi:hypothetical protein BH11BAC3_BH11BAC3_23750 [soil metagenome]
MKIYLIVAATTLLFASCLKQSIPDAILSAEQSGTGGGAATLTYKVNGNPVNIRVANARKPEPLFL